MAKYGIIIDTTKCNGCYNCFLACRDEFCGNDYPGYAAAQPQTGHFWMRVIEKERGKYPKVKVNYTSVTCMHCDNPSCVQGSLNGAVIKRPDGIVWIDPVKSKGQKEIVTACPHRVIYWNQEKEIPQKCNLCAHLLDQGWKEPRCVEACPTGALIFGDIDDKNSAISKLWNSAEIEELHPEYKLKPRVKYIGLPKRFIAGSVIFKNKKDECAEGVTVTITDSKGAKQTVKTNNYGDFELENLGIDTEYTVKLENTGYVTQEHKVKTKIDVYMGDIVLAPKPKVAARAK